MQLFHLYHNHLHKMISSDFWLFEFSIWLHVFARSLIAIFVPIFLIQLGYSINAVLWFYALFCVFDVPLNFFARNLVRRLGARWVLALGTIFIIAFFLLLRSLEADSVLQFVALALSAALYDTFYWIAHLFLFMESDTGSKDSGAHTGVLYSVKMAAGLIAPMLGAGILIFFDESSLIITSVVIFALSLLPLIYVDDFPDKPKSSHRSSFREFFSEWQERKNFTLSALFSLHSAAEGVLWPLFIFTLLERVESVALVPVLVSLTAILFSYLAGRINGKVRDWVIGLGALLIAGVWILRTFLDASFFLYASVFLVGFFSLFVSIPIDSNLFTRAKVRDALDTATYRNVALMFVRVFFYGALALLVSVFKVSFIIAAMSMFLLLTVNYFFLKKYSVAPMSGLTK